ncbi:MAG: DNA polymerase IV [Anaerolineaceae bacterium]|nr:DNA polymerase IV [Anaerolineaceae bacterium]
MMERKIIHVDLDAFFCSVEELLDPSLNGIPFAVGGTKGRGVVASCSYAARMFGVHSAMPSAQALRLCPQLKFVHHTHHLYGEYSDKVMQILRDFTPLFQQVSVDEAYLDVSDLPQKAGDIAREIQAKVDRQTHLPTSMGVAVNKLVAKLANDFGKSRLRTAKAPHAITVVKPGKEAAFMAGLDIQCMLGIGPKTAQKMRSRGLNTIGDLAACDDRLLFSLFSDYGPELKERAQGIDHSKVHSEHDDQKSCSNETTFSEDSVDLSFLLDKLRTQSEKVGYRLRRDGLAGSVVQIKLRYSDFTTFTRQKALGVLTNIDEEIYKAAAELLLKNLMRSRPVRLLGVGLSNLDSPHRQMAFWDDQFEEKIKLAAALDSINDRYGKQVVQRASQLYKGKDFRQNGVDE